MIKLSNLNRAALGGQERYEPIHWAAFAYMALIALFSANAWVVSGEPFRAALCIGAQILSIVCAVLARRALTGEMPILGGVFLICTVGCSVWAGEGLRHAWEANGAESNPLMITFLMSLEPGIFVAAEHIKEGRAAIRTNHDMSAREQAEELARIRAKQDVDDERRRHERDRPTVMERVAAGAGVGVGVLAPGAAHADMLPVMTHVAPTHERAVIVSSYVGHRNARAHLEALMASGVTARVELQAQIATVGQNIPISTVSRWAREWEKTQERRDRAGVPLDRVRA